LVVDTGVFSASLSRRRPMVYDRLVARLAGNQLFLASPTVAELRYGALVAQWAKPRRDRLEAAMAVTTVVPVTDSLLSAVAELRFACRRIGHPLASSAHSSDLWIAGSAVSIRATLITGDQVFSDTPGLSLA